MRFQAIRIIIKPINSIKSFKTKDATESQKY